MAISIEQLSGIGFLPFPEQTELLISEIKNRFGFTDFPSKRYGDLIYFENKSLYYH